MSNHLEAVKDAPQNTNDTSSASSAMLSEVNNDRQTGKTNDNKSFDQSVESRINELFGNLTLGGDNQVSAATNTRASLFEFAPSDSDKQALRDLGQKARDKTAEVLEPEKKARVDTLGEGIKDEKAKEQFKRDLETIEHRNPPLSVAERGRFYDQVQKLMEAGDNPNVPLNSDDRTKLAEQIVHKTADPTSIDQGLKATCNVATVEARSFTRDPAAAAKVIVDVATIGEYTAPDGTKVKPDPGSIKPDVEVQHADLFKNPA